MFHDVITEVRRATKDVFSLMDFSSINLFSMKMHFIIFALAMTVITPLILSIKFKKYKARLNLTLFSMLYLLFCSVSDLVLQFWSLNCYFDMQGLLPLIFHLILTIMV